ncbi:MAG: hypothetical protein RJA87_1961 [Pseudomonadota bacterium]|jgi:hypothetical protein
MTPTAAEVLMGNFMALIEPPPQESVGDYMASRISVIGMNSLLASQETEMGAAVRVWENEAISAVLSKAGAPLAASTEDLSITALDALNAKLRLALIAVHEAVEAKGDVALDREILTLYQAMADRRMLVLPVMPGS